MAARQQRFKIRVFLLLYAYRQPFWANELHLLKYPENIQLAPKPYYGDTPSPSTGDNLDLDYGEDIVIFADLLDTLKDALYIFTEQSQKLWLHVNWSKTKLQSFSPWIPTPPSTLIGTQPVTTTDNFTYLGSTIASNNSSFNDVNRRIAIATSTMSKLSSLWTSCRLSLVPKMRLYNSLIMSIITYS